MQRVEDVHMIVVHILVSVLLEKQKNNYLPKLASGKLIPCFGLTGPNNGSDATGNIDVGIVKQINNNRYIELAQEDFSKFALEFIKRTSWKGPLTRRVLRR